MDEETQTLLTQWKMDDYIELFEEKPESNQSGVAVENAKEFSDVSDFILNINNKVWSNKQKVIIIVNSSALTYYLESVSSDNALFEFEDSSDLLQWLENCTDPWDTVESHWIRTAGTRLKLVKNTNAPASVYINKYPALKKPTDRGIPVGGAGPVRFGAAADTTALAVVRIEGKYFRMRRDLCVGEAVVTSRVSVGVRRMVSLSGYQHYTSPPAKSRFSVMQRDVMLCSGLSNAL
ncbi:hypothetical protein EVAR_27790_1 [Eumeta japonica]|uniref:Uncharacterized protein n=1 Tax=Eumeta variegata TaxID=151549 RepID=A0A4C1VLH3_EUMVA|nr:hypothetical protein EVAR_27790_1 [Eumeta japonica]